MGITTFSITTTRDQLMGIATSWDHHFPGEQPVGTTTSGSPPFGTTTSRDRPCEVTTVRDGDFSGNTVPADTAVHRPRCPVCVLLASKTRPREHPGTATHPDASWSV